MDGIYTWIRNLTGYFLFITILEQLMPGKQYGKYVRFFAGMVLILLVLQPLTDNVRMEARIAQDYEALLFQYDAEDLKNEIFGMEEDRLRKLVRQYEEAVAMDVRQMAEDAGVHVESCQVTICADQDAEAFGTVSGVKLQTSLDRRSEDSDLAGEGVTIESVKPVEQIRLGEDRPDYEKAGEGDDEKEQETEADREAAVVGSTAASVTAGLRKKIAEYYDLEEAYVEIQMVQGER